MSGVGCLDGTGLRLRPRDSVTDGSSSSVWYDVGVDVGAGSVGEGSPS